jgi:hypothetical protein
MDYYVLLKTSTRPGKATETVTRHTTDTARTPAYKAACKNIHKEASGSAIHEHNSTKWETKLVKRVLL